MLAVENDRCGEVSVPPHGAGASIRPSVAERDRTDLHVGAVRWASRRDCIVGRVPVSQTSAIHWVERQQDDCQRVEKPNLPRIFQIWNKPAVDALVVKISLEEFFDLDWFLRINRKLRRQLQEALKLANLHAR